ncbi:hypothetical protein FG062_14265 [Vibrio cholerae]|nr:hypothetical protein [Vibrio cholerae]EGR0600780.1 hypothetical protein [Vibrio cholerae]
MKSAIVLILLGLIGFCYKHMTIQPTPSMSHSLYWRSSVTPQKGDAVNFSFTHPLVLGGRSVLFLKRLACVEGDTLTVGINGYYSCNDKVIGSGTQIVIGDKTIDNFKFNGVIPKGMGFVLGDSPDSFDSRFWGFKPLSEMTRLIPLI